MSAAVAAAGPEIQVWEAAAAVADLLVVQAEGPAAVADLAGIAETPAAAEPPAAAAGLAERTAVAVDSAEAAVGHPVAWALVLAEEHSLCQGVKQSLNNVCSHY